MRFKTIHPDGDAYEAVLMCMKRLFVVLRIVTNFELDGTMIFPKKVICGCRDAKFEECYNDIIRNNQQIDSLSSPQWLHNCESIREVISELMQRDIWPGIEVLFDKDKVRRSAFFIGPIVEIKKNKFFVKCYDAAGKWEKVYPIRYDEVFRIEFDSKYCNHFNEYMKTHNKDGRTDAA